MAELALVAMGAGAILSTIGQIQEGRAAAAAGKAEQAALEYRAKIQQRQAQSLENEANQRRAISQREAEEERLKGKFLSSRARALSAASGAVIDSNLLGDIDFETDYRVLSQLASGEGQARGLEHQAALTRAGAEGDIYAGSVAAAEGKAARQRSKIKAVGSLLEGAAGIGSKYADMFPTKPTIPKPPPSRPVYPWSI